MMRRRKGQAHAAVPSLDDVKSGQDRSSWRIAHQYLIVNEFENFRPFKAPRKAHINHKVKPELLIAMLSVEQVQLGAKHIVSNSALITVN